jgi:hypothetical protein
LVFNYNKNKFTLFDNDLISVIDVQKMMDEYYNITTHTGFTTTELLSTKWINTTFEVSENWTSPSPSSVTQMTLMNTSTTMAGASLCGNQTDDTLRDGDHSYLMGSFVYVCVLLFIGLPGNALVIYVYLLKWPKSTSRIFILALATYDLINCTTSMPFELGLILNFSNFDFPVLCKVSRFITGMINNTTTFLLIVIAVDRFKRICRPHNRHITPPIGKKLVAIATVFGLCTSWPMLVLYGTMTIPHGKTCLIEDRMLSTKFPMLFIIFLLLGHFVTDCILITLYAFVGKVIFNRRHILKSSRAKLPKAEISQSSYTVDELDTNDQEENRSRLASFVFWNRVSDEFRKRGNTTGNIQMTKKQISPKKSVSLFRRALSRGSDKESNRNKARVGKTTLMLFLVTVVFIVSFIPHTGMVILRYTHPKFVLCLSYLGKSVYQLTLRTYLLNSVLNPMVYCFVSNQFRSKCKQALKQLFCCDTSKGTSRTISDGHSGHA